MPTKPLGVKFFSEGVKKEDGIQQSESMHTLYAAAREMVASWITKRRDSASVFNASKRQTAISILSLKTTGNGHHIIVTAMDTEQQKGVDGQST